MGVPSVLIPVIRCFIDVTRGRAILMENLTIYSPFSDGEIIVKSFVIHNDNPSLIDYILGDIVLQRTQRICDLGINFHPHLTLIPHSEGIVATANRMYDYFSKKLLRVQKCRNDKISKSLSDYVKGRLCLFSLESPPNNFEN